MAQANTRRATLTQARVARETLVSHAALAPWVEYLSRLHEPDRSVMMHDLKVVAGLEIPLR